MSSMIRVLSHWIKRRSFLQRLREATSGSYDWYSAPNRRTAQGKQPGREFLIPDFSNGDDFSTGLYAGLYAFDIQDLDFRFRLKQWGVRGPSGTGGTVPINYVRMVYAFPNFENPTKAIELEQLDIASSMIGQYHQLSYDECQEALLLSLNQNLYASSDRERWFHHMDKRTAALDAIPGTSAVLDYWRGPRRGYCIARVFANDVRIQAVLSGFDEEEAVSILQRLAPIAGNDGLAEWHDTTIRRMRTIGQSFEGNNPRGS